MTFESTRKTILLLVFLAFSFSVGQMVGCAKKKPEGNKLGAEFEVLRKDVLNGKYQESIPKLIDFVDKNPKSKQASRAGLFLFKCYFALDKSTEAKKWCDWTIEKYPQSLEAQKCKFKLAMIQLVDGEIEEAKASLEKLAVNPSVPQSPEARRFSAFLNNYSIEKKD